MLSISESYECSRHKHTLVMPSKFMNMDTKEDGWSVHKVAPGYIHASSAEHQSIWQRETARLSHCLSFLNNAISWQIAYINEKYTN